MRPCLRRGKLGETMAKALDSDEEPGALSRTDAELIRASGLFDLAYYLDQAPDVPDSEAAAVNHYLTVGWAAGLSPHRLFDGHTYRARHPQMESEPELLHFLATADVALARAEAEADVPMNQVTGRTTAVITTTGAPRATARCVRMLRSNSGTDVEILVVDNAARGPVPLVVLLVAQAYELVRVIRLGDRTSDADARNRGAACASGDVLAFMSHRTVVEPGWAEPLRAALDAGAGVVQPRVLAPDGTIVTTGMTWDRSAEPTDVLHKFPGDDPRAGVAAHREAVTQHCLAVGRASFDAVGGFASGMPAAVAAADLSLRLSTEGLGAVRYVPESTVVASPGKERGELAKVSDWRRFSTQWAHILGSQARTRVELPSAQIARAEPRPLRWAIKLASPFSRRRRWGDYHFANSLAGALRRLEQDVVIDCREAWYRDTAVHDDVVLALRGLEAYEPQPHHVNLLWAISHTDDVAPQEWRSFDYAFCATIHDPSSMASSRDSIEALLQATDPELFRPGPAETSLRHDVLFVGNSRSRVRTVVQDALSAGLRLAVYGEGWADSLPPGVLMGEFIPNDQLAGYYRSAGVVLNDHWEDMRRDGMVSNRLFDLAACGSTVVTDVVPGMEAVFGNVFYTYGRPQELGQIVRRLLAAPDYRLRERLNLAAHIRQHHTFDVRARRLLAAACTEVKEVRIP